jgi:hypothetical protein
MGRSDHYELVLSALVSEASRAQVRERGIRHAATIEVTQGAGESEARPQKPRTRLPSADGGTVRRGFEQVRPSLLRR